MTTALTQISLRLVVLVIAAVSDVFKLFFLASVKK